MENTKFDVIIVGAGVGGLVCGCYLAKFGLKVLIVEQQSKPGGCCTSFQRGGFNFDVGVHYLGSCRADQGIIFRVLKDHNLLEKIDLVNISPHDRIITPNEDIFISKNINRLVSDLITYFPDEKTGIINLINFMQNTELFTLYVKTRGRSFQEVLDEFLIDYKLKAIFSIPLGNFALPPSRVSAFASILLYREYVFDGGYYPRGGIQQYPNLLAKCFVDYGGEIQYSSRVDKIVFSNNCVKGIVTNNQYIETNIIVSNIDANTTFNVLIDSDSIERELIANMELSPSAFIVYLGIQGGLNTLKKNLCTWFFSTYNIEKCYDTRKFYNLEQGLLNQEHLDYLVCHFSEFADTSLVPLGMSSIRTEIFVNQENINNWTNFKEVLFNRTIKSLENIIPDISTKIILKEVATPMTINKWVSTKNGSILGWAATVNQESKSLFPAKTSIDGLYLAGSWAINGFGQSGIVNVTLSGLTTSEIILKTKMKTFKQK